jgi:hypothetical protein
LKTAESVADILERELDPTINEWLKRVNLVPELTKIPLSDSDRTGHLPKLFNDVISRLRLPRDFEPPLSMAVTVHGRIRFEQGYSLSMLVEESRIFEVATFRTLHLYQNKLDQSQVLLDVITIAGEVDRQLGETVSGFELAKGAN